MDLQHLQLHLLWLGHGNGHPGRQILWGKGPAESQKDSGYSHRLCLCWRDLADDTFGAWSSFDDAFMQYRSGHLWRCQIVSDRLHLRFDRSFDFPDVFLYLKKLWRYETSALLFDHFFFCEYYLRAFVCQGLSHGCGRHGPGDHHFAIRYGGSGFKTDLSL